MRGLERSSDADLLETKMTQIRVKDLRWVQRTMDVLQGGAVHTVADSEIPVDELGRLVTPENAVACAHCGAVGSRESFKVCSACGAYTCGRHRFLDASGEVHCLEHDHIGRLFRALLGWR